MAEEPEERYDVFLSYNSADLSAVRPLAEALRARQLTAWFAPSRTIVGRQWQKAIAKGLRQSEACALVVGPNGLGDWQLQELDIAQERAVKDDRFRVFLVLLPGRLT